MPSGTATGHAAAARELDEYEGDEPWPSIHEIITTLLATYPDLGIRLRVDEVVPVIIALAAKHGLVCFDPQREELVH